MKLFVHSALALTLALYTLACGDSSSTPSCIEVINLVNTCDQTWKEASSETYEPPDKSAEQECAEHPYDQTLLNCVHAALEGVDCTNQAQVDAATQANKQCGDDFEARRSDEDEETPEGCEGESDCGEATEATRYPGDADDEGHHHEDDDHDHAHEEAGGDER